MSFCGVKHISNCRFKQIRQGGRGNVLLKEDSSENAHGQLFNGSVFATMLSHRFRTGDGMFKNKKLNKLLDLRGLEFVK